MAGFFNLSKPGIRDRRHERFHCERRAELFLAEKLVTLHGMVIEMSRSGALFREASRYILDRRGMPVLLRIGGFEFAGKIVNARPTGYGILFERTLEDSEFQAIFQELQQDAA